MNKVRKKTITQTMFFEAKICFSAYKNNITRKAFEKNYKKFILYCRKHFNSKTNEECKLHIQDYANHLKEQGKTASTIHTYIAPICIYFKIPMNEIEKPKRYASENIRGRSFNNKLNRTDNDFNNLSYERLVKFQKCVGIRKNELKHLKRSDYLETKSGFFVVVRRGKGGKRQLQKILPKDVGFIKSYFDGSENNMFSSYEMKNKLNLHYLRAKSAQEFYNYYLNKINGPDGEKYKQDIKKEIKTYWIKYNKTKNGNTKPFPKDDFEGTYFLRGKNKTFALNHNLPIKYDKLILYYTSIFKLSHWRLSVTVDNYIMCV